MCTRHPLTAGLRAYCAAFGAPAAVAAVVTLSTAIAPSPLRAQAPAPTDPAAAAADAAKQLDLGEQWFRSACLECHAVGSLANADFRLKWGGRSAFDLFELIRSTMPEHEPGSLSVGTYASIVAYLMKVNGMPVGTSAVPSDSSGLALIRLAFPAASPAASALSPAASPAALRGTPR